jgi:hypothetical protein
MLDTLLAHESDLVYHIVMQNEPILAGLDRPGMTKTE